MKLRPFLNIVATGLGIIMVLSPLALWTAWSEKMFYGILPNIRAVILRFVADGQRGSSTGPKINSSV